MKISKLFNLLKTNFRDLIKIAYPIMIGHLSHIMLGIEDSLMVGRVGVDELAAASFSNSVFILILIFGIGFSFSITSLTAIAHGQSQKGRISEIFYNGVFIHILLGIFIFIITLAISRNLNLFSQTEEITLLSESYLMILSISSIPFMAFQSIRQFIEGFSFTKPAMYIVITANVINIIANWILIYGNLGFPKLGLDGAGYATISTRFFMMISIIIYLLFSKNFKEYKFRIKNFVFNKILTIKIIKLGTPIGFQGMSEVGAFSFSTIMVGWFGADALAAHQIALSFSSITFMIILGISGAAAIKVSFYFGKNEIRNMKAIGYSSIILSAIIMAIFGIVIIFSRDLLPRLFVDDPEVIIIASILLIIVALYQVFDGVQAVGLALLRGITDVKIPLYTSIFAYWIAGIPMGYALGFYFDLNVYGVWLGLSIGLIIAAFLFTNRFKIKISHLAENSIF